MPDTGLTIVSDALTEIGVLNAVDPPSGEDAALALRILNRLLDLYNADHRAIFTYALSEHELTPSLQPHLFGPGGSTNFVVAQRPQRIERANLIVSGDIRRPLELRDREWWIGLGTPEATAEDPTDLYYEPSWPNGKIFLAPIQTGGNFLELLTATLLSAIELSTVISLPPGYKEMLTLTLAEKCAAPFRVGLSQETKDSARDARARVFGANRRIPTLVTADYGLGGGAGDDYDYHVGPLG